MAVSRRQFLIGARLAAAATGGLTACGSDSGSGGGGEGGGTNMAFAWWGMPFGTRTPTSRSPRTWRPIPG